MYFYTLIKTLKVADLGGACLRTKRKTNNNAHARAKGSIYHRNMRKET